MRQAARVRVWKTVLGACLAALTVIGASGPSKAEETVYTYDALGRLIAAVDGSGKAVTYRYDDAGNRTQLGNDKNFAEIVPTGFSASSNAGTTGLTAASGMRDGQYGATDTVQVTTAEADAWVRGNFQAATYVNHACVAPAAAAGAGPSNLNGAELQYTTDGVAWHSAATVSGVAAGECRNLAIRVTVLGVRLRRTDGAALGVGDFRFFSSPAPGEAAAPVAYNKTLNVAFNTPQTVDLTPGGAWTSVAIATSPIQGSVTVNGTTAQATYTPNSGATGADSFTYTATGPGGVSSPATVSITIAAGAAPVVADKSISVSWHGSQSVDLTPSGGWTTVQVATPPQRGTVSITGATAVYTHTSNLAGNDSFTYTATGPGGTSSTATVTVTVASGAPTVSNKSLSVAYNTAGSVDLAPAGAWTSVQVATPPQKGTVSISGSTATYTPNNLQYGGDSFTFTATGPGGTSAPATVSVTIAPPPAPVVSTKEVYLQQDTSTTLDLQPGGVWTSIAISAGPAHGSATLNGSVVSYTPQTGFYGNDYVEFSATGPGGTSGVAYGWFRVQPAAPVVSNKTLTVNYMAPGLVSLTPTGQWNNLSIVSGPSKGTLNLNSPAAQVEYTPSSGQTGADSFTYKATGTGGDSNVATVSVTITPPPAPSVTAKSLTVNYGSPGSVTLTASGHYSTFQISTQGAKGVASIVNSVATYTPNSGQTGTDTFYYTATGPGGVSAPAAVSVTINPPAPGVTDKEVYLSQNTSASLNLAPSGSWTSVTILSGPFNGSASLSGSTVTYTPNANWYGNDYLDFRANGPGGQSNTARAWFRVQAAAPVVSNKSMSVSYESVGLVSLTPSGQWSSVSIVSNPSKGTISLNSAAAQAQYTANAGQLGADSFTYRATGPGGTSNTATVSVTINPPPPPTVTAKSLNVGYNTAGSVGLTASGYYSSFAISSQGSKGTASVSGSTATYTPFNGQTGSDTFYYTATGIGGTSTPAAVSVTITAAPFGAGVNSTTYNRNRIGSAWSIGSPSSIIVTASGGSGSYSYLWERLSGDTNTTAASSTSATTVFTKSQANTFDATYTSTWRCRVTDIVSGAVAYSPNVNVTINYMGN